MRRDRLLHGFRKLLSSDLRYQLEKRDKLRRILAGMRKKQQELERTLAGEPDREVRNELRRQLRVVKEQRRKGLDVLNELRGGRKE
jgi:hypothetical protein